MIGYVTLGTNDLERAASYYDALFGVMDVERAMERDNVITWAKSPDQPMLGAIRPHDGNPATVGNGVMVALMTESREQVDDVYRKAMELGSLSEGEPGERSPGFYVAYFRDLEGNKLAVYVLG